MKQQFVIRTYKYMLMMIIHNHEHIQVYTKLIISGNSVFNHVIGSLKLDGIRIVRKPLDKCREFFAVAKSGIKFFHGCAGSDCVLSCSQVVRRVQSEVNNCSRTRVFIHHERVKAMLSQGTCHDTGPVLVGVSVPSRICPGLVHESSQSVVRQVKTRCMHADIWDQSYLCHVYACVA